MWLTLRLPAYCGVGLEPESWTPMSLVLKALTMAMTAPNSICGFIVGMVMYMIS